MKNMIQKIILTTHWQAYYCYILILAYPRLISGSSLIYCQTLSEFILKQFSQIDNIALCASKNNPFTPSVEKEPCQQRHFIFSVEKVLIPMKLPSEKPELIA
ncbi:hypothetical protein RW64_02180 [Geobacter sulfurreducens]|nr:hypothetical protein RW64_02180 [Geobacter sulfurreducens]